MGLAHDTPPLCGHDTGSIRDQSQSQSTSHMEERITRVEEDLHRLIALIQGDQARLPSSVIQAVEPSFQNIDLLSAPIPSSISVPVAPSVTLAEWVKDFGSNEVTSHGPHSSVSPALDSQPPSPTYSDYSFDCIPTGVLQREEILRARNDGHLGVVEDHVRHLTWERFREGFRDRNDEQSSHKRSRLSRRTITARNPMDVGLCSYAEGQELLDLFFAHSHVYAPAYDRSIDTWERLSSECPFSTSAILYVVKRIRDEGRSVSTLQEAFRDHAEELCRHTLFSPISSFDALQAMIVMASWGETSWRPSSHALSMALDMGLDKCLGKLSQLDFRTDPSSHRSLVVGSRVWLQVFIMSNGSVMFHKRPGSVPKIDVTDAHRLLEHPLSQSEDSRLVSFVELWALLDNLVPDDLSNLTINEMDLILRSFHLRKQTWLQKWLGLYAQRSTSEDDTMVTDLKVLDAMLRLRFNSMVLRFVSTKQQVHRLPAHRRQYLLDALEAARELVRKLLHTDYVKFKYATHYTHLGLVMAIKLYIRLARFFGDRLDLRQTAGDVKMAAQILDTFPGVSITEDIRRAIGQARLDRIFPPEAPSYASRQSSVPRPSAQTLTSSVGFNLNAGLEHGSSGDETTSASQTQDPIWDFDTLFGDWAEVGESMGAPSGNDVFNADWWSIPFQ